MVPEIFMHRFANRVSCVWLCALSQKMTGSGRVRSPNRPTPIPDIETLRSAQASPNSAWF